MKTKSLDEAKAWQSLDARRAEFVFAESDAYIIALAGFFVLLTAERQEQNRIAVRAFDEGSDDLLNQLNSSSRNGDWRDWKFYHRERDGSLTDYLQAHVIDHVRKRYAGHQHPLALLADTFDLRSIEEDVLESAFNVAQPLATTEEHNLAALEETFAFHFKRWWGQTYATDYWKKQSASAETKRLGVDSVRMALVDLLLEIAEIECTGTLYCPAFGLGDLLVEAVKHCARSQESDPSLAGTQLCVSGIELNRGSVLITLARLMLAGAAAPRLVLGDPLESSPGNARNNGGFDRVIAVPPFGIRVEAKFSRPYRIPSQSGDNLYLQHVLDSLKPDGLAVIIVARALLFRDSDRKLREYLLREFRVEAVIELSSLAPWTTLQSSILVISRKPPLDDVWFITAEDQAEIESYSEGDGDYSLLLAALHARLRRRDHRKIEAEINELTEGIEFQRATFDPKKEQDWGSYEQTLRLARHFLSSDQIQQPYAAGSRLVPIAKLASRDWQLIYQSASPQPVDAFLAALIKAVPSARIVPLRDLADVSSGVTYSKAGIVDEKEYRRQRLKEPPVGLFRVSDLPRVDRLKSTESYTIYNRLLPKALIPDAAAKLPEKALLRKGDVLLSVGGTVGKVGLFQGFDNIGIVRDRKTTASNGIAVARFRTPGLESFVARLLLSAPYQEWMTAESTGSTIRHLNISRLRELPIPVLPRAEQLRLMDVLEAGVSAETMVASLCSRPEYTEAIRFVADLPALRAFAELSVRKAGAKAETALFDMLKELEAALANRREASSEPFLEWLLAFRQFAEAVYAALTLPPGSERFAALQGMRLGRRTRFPRLFQAYQSIRNSLAHASDERIPFGVPGHLLIRIQALYDRLREICAVNEETMLADVRVTASVQPAAVPVSRPVELTISLRNDAVLPLHGVQLLEPETSMPRCQLLPAGGTYHWAVPWTPIEVGKKEFQVRWSAVRLNGASATGNVTVAVEVHSLRELGSVQRVRRSPYVAGLSLSAKDKDKFFGRQDIIAEITRSLRLDGPGTVLILEGVRRVGKTSLLKQFLAADALPGWIVTYCSFQRGKGHETKHGLITSELFYTVAREVVAAAHSAGCTANVPGFRLFAPTENAATLKEDMRTALRAAFTNDPAPFELLESVIASVLDAASGRHLLLMLDEFDKIQVGIESGVTSPQVPDNLRELFHCEPRVSAILSGSQLMKRLRREYFSPLFGLARADIPIGALDLVSAQQLVTHPAEGLLVFPDVARDRIVELCACQPFLIQHICAQVFDICSDKNTQSVTLEHVERATEAWLDREQHFSEVWRDDVEDPRRQYLLCIIAELEGSGAVVTFDLLRDTLEERMLSGDKALADHLDFLVGLTLVARDDRDGHKIYRIAVPLLSRWLAAKVDASQYLARAVREDEGRL